VTIYETIVAHNFAGTPYFQLPAHRIQAEMSSFSIRPAEATDVPAMARLAADASATDLNTQVKARGSEPYDHEATMLELLPNWIARPAARGFTVVATDDATGEVLGWVCWGRAGFVPPAPDAEEEEPTDHDAKEREVMSEPDSVKRLSKLTSANMMRWMDALMPKGTKCMFFISIAVAPAHQGRGVGAALIRTGTERADADGVFIWVCRLLILAN
jgi:GNAT superfamily N-acetyltransferase